MKPLLDLNRPVQRRSGEPARVISRDLKGEYPVVAAIAIAGDQEIVATFTLDGIFSTIDGKSSRDLINVRARRL